MRYHVLRGFCLGNGVDLHPGQVAEIPEQAAKLFIRQGRIVPVTPEINVARASLVAAILIAPSLEELNELVTADETDGEIIAAYQQRANELTEAENTMEDDH